MSCSRAVLILAVVASGCVSLPRKKAGRAVCQTSMSDMGPIECDTPVLSGCGVSLFNCLDGATYLCMDEVVCDSEKSEVDVSWE